MSAGSHEGARAVDWQACTYSRSMYEYDAVRSFAMAQVEDTQLSGTNYQPGVLLEDGKWRVEFDSMGQVKVPADRLWGAQTQRSLIHFSIGNDRMPVEVYHAYGYVKKAAAIINERLGHLLPEARLLR